MPTTPALFMPDDRHPADQAVTLPKKQRNPICILDEFFFGKISDGQHPSFGVDRMLVIRAGSSAGKVASFVHALSSSCDCHAAVCGLLRGLPPLAVGT